MRHPHQSGARAATAPPVSAKLARSTRRLSPLQRHYTHEYRMTLAEATCFRDSLRILTARSLLSRAFVERPSSRITTIFVLEDIRVLLAGELARGKSMEIWRKRNFVRSAILAIATVSVMLFSGYALGAPTLAHGALSVPVGGLSGRDRYEPGRPRSFVRGPSERSRPRGPKGIGADSPLAGSGRRPGRDFFPRHHSFSQ